MRVTNSSVYISARQRLTRNVTRLFLWHSSRRSSTVHFLLHGSGTRGRPTWPLRRLTHHFRGSWKLNLFHQFYGSQQLRSDNSVHCLYLLCTYCFVILKCFWLTLILVLWWRRRRYFMITLVTTSSNCF